MATRSALVLVAVLGLAASGAAVPENRPAPVWHAVSASGTVHSGVPATASRIAEPGSAGARTADAAAPARTLKPGDKGADVLALQRRLTELGYWLSTPSGTFGPLTTQAVYALQKAAGLPRDAVVGLRTRRALELGVRPGARTDSGKVVEVDLARQLLLLVRDGDVVQIFNTSTGSGQLYTSRGTVRRAVTPAGRYHFYRKVDGWDSGPLGALYRPVYFNGGIAVHGYGSVPPYPASHGCVRVSLAAMDWLWKTSWLPIGRTVLVR
ncbi:L,D-transpeptidase family protein [Planotetraspora sp. GP83]|uniref:L,D-transpeptidase family protein n=1 Tax=Planotetraspora sp. GP83 TaxID=3156264 RepID=UPI0035118E93